MFWKVKQRIRTPNRMAQLELGVKPKVSLGIDAAV